MLRTLLLTTALTGVLAVVEPSPTGDVKETKSALESDPTGWLDWLADPKLTDWKRVSIPPGSKLSAKNPWSFNQETKLLECDAVGIHEMLLYSKEFSDGIFHV